MSILSSAIAMVNEKITHVVFLLHTCRKLLSYTKLSLPILSANALNMSCIVSFIDINYKRYR